MFFKIGSVFSYCDKKDMMQVASNLEKRGLIVKKIQDSDKNYKIVVVGER